MCCDRGERSFSSRVGCVVCGKAAAMKLVLDMLASQDTGRVPSSSKPLPAPQSAEQFTIRTMRAAMSKALFLSSGSDCGWPKAWVRELREVSGWVWISFTMARMSLWQDSAGTAANRDSGR